MSFQIKKQAQLLKTLADSHPQVRKAILAGGGDELLKCISECAYNILYTIQLTPSEKAALSKYKQKIRRVADPDVSISDKTKVIQSGGFLPALLAPLITSVIAPLTGEAVKGIAKAISKKKKHGKRTTPR